MIIFKIVLTAIMLFGLLTLAFVVADVLTDLRYEWLDNLTQILVQVFLFTLLICLTAGLIFMVGLLIWSVWTQM